MQYKLNMNIPPPFSYPFPSPMPWQPIPFPSSLPYPMPQPMFPRKPRSSSTSLSNTRYRQLKQQTHNFDRRSETRSISRSTSARLLKTHSSNLSVAYAHEAHLTPKPRRKGSLRRKPRSLPPPPPPPQRKPSFRRHRQPKRPVYIPERGIVRISTLDELPMVSHRAPSINHDRISIKGSISNSSQHRIKTKEISRSVSNDGRTNTSNFNSDGHSSSSSSSSLSIQQRLNGSLRNDPLITAAMEDYRQLRRSNSQTISLASEPSSSDRHSQSSFTSVERSEIRQLIQTVKRKDSTPLNTVLQSSPNPSEHSINLSSFEPSEPISRPKKSPLTEELDREFSKLRARDPDQDMVNVIPSSICKRRRTPEKATQPTIPLPTFGELLRKVQLRPIDRTMKSPPPPLPPPPPLKEKSLLSIPVPRSSPIPMEEIKVEEVKHEYAVPVKQNTNRRFLPQISHFQPSHHISVNRSASRLLQEKRTSRSLAMLNWFHQNLTNPFPTTFQPTRILDQTKESITPHVTENIYTSTTDLDLPASVIDQNLQLHLENQSILTDDSYSDYEAKHTTQSSSKRTEFSRLFVRKRENQRCSIM